MIDKSIDDIVIRCSCSDEAETVISFNKNEDMACIYTTDNTTLTKLKKMVKNNPNEYKVLDITKSREGDVTSVSVTCPKKLISFRAKREMTEEQKEASGERMKKMWEKRRESNDG